MADRVESVALSARDLYPIFKEHLPSIDANGTGMASQKELDAAIRFAPDERTRLALHAIHENWYDLQDLASDVRVNYRYELSLNDMKEFHKYAAKDRDSVPDNIKTLLDDVEILLPGTRDLKDPRGFAYALMGNFSTLDVDGDGDVSKQDLAVLRRTADGELEDVVDKLETHFDEFNADAKSGISRNDARAFFGSYNNYYAETGLERRQREARSEAFWNATPWAASAGVFGAVTVPLAVIAVADPEPFSKVVVGAHAVLTGTFTLLTGATAYSEYTKGEQKVERLAEIHDIQLQGMSKYGFK